jgi:hypothetical protein
LDPAFFVAAGALGLTVVVPAATEAGATVAEVASVVVVVVVVVVVAADGLGPEAAATEGLTVAVVAGVLAADAGAACTAAAGVGTSTDCTGTWGTGASPPQPVTIAVVPRAASVMVMWSRDRLGRILISPCLLLSVLEG